ncbi:MAG: DUF2523 domain-containing protein [Pseudomonadota bacterium]
MPALVAWIGTLIASSIGGWAIQVLIGLGIGLVTYEGIDVAMNYLKSMAVQSANGLGSQVLGMLSVMRVGQCINIILSAMAVRQGLNGVMNGTLKRFVKT